MDQYLKALNDVCDGLEEVYGVALVADTGSKLLDEDINVVLEEVDLQLKEIGDSGISDRNIKAFDYVSLLAHVVYRIEFFEYHKVNFNGYPYKDRLVDALSVFSSRRNLTKKSVKFTNLIVNVLSVVDKDHLNLRFEITYRLLRIFVIMVMYSNYAEASILSNFLLKQLKRSV